VRACFHRTSPLRVCWHLEGKIKGPSVDYSGFRAVGDVVLSTLGTASSGTQPDLFAVDRLQPAMCTVRLEPSTWGGGSPLPLAPDSLSSAVSSCSALGAGANIPLGDPGGAPCKQAGCGGPAAAQPLLPWAPARMLSKPEELSPEMLFCSPFSLWVSSSPSAPKNATFGLSRC